MTIALGALADLQIGISDDPRMDVAVLVKSVKDRAAKRKRHGLPPTGLVIVDYLGLIRNEGHAESRNQEVSKISRDLKLAAKELDVPMIALSQLTRTNEHENRRPEPRDLRDSGSLEQDADVIIFLHQQKASYGLQVIPVEMIIPKQRQGPKFTMDMNFHVSTMTFDVAEVRDAQ